MALSNRERLSRAFELLAPALGSYVDRAMRARSESGQAWFTRWQERERNPVSLQDPAFQLKVMSESWEQVFRTEMARTDRNLIYELRDVRNRLFHNQQFTVDDTYRALDSMERLLAAIGAAEAPEVGRSKDELMRLRYEADTARSAARQEVLLASPRAGLKPWREVIAPHADVLRGRFSVAEFAADLYQVSLGRGSAEYADPVEFFARTYLTGGLRRLLTEALRRLVHAEGTPVINLQTTFGGGKTHSQIALWHLFSETPVSDFPDDVRSLLAEAGVTGELPEVTRAALVGTKISPGQPSVKDDGTEVSTLWGELAWQLGGREGYDLVGAADRTGTNPGANLDLLLERYSPCLILIDEWVGYARQLVSADNLPGGSFDTQFSFAQALTEAARATPGALLVVALPASTEADRTGGGLEIELGGPGGREALRRLHSVVGRIESPWQPATYRESFEIVRRRLFKPLDPELLADRDTTARAFGEMYRRESAEFPAECREVGYVERIKAAYPIHPELFARLYEDWSTLDRFQLTRGVLRLMADVIHALWEGGDQSPLMLPASVPIAHPAVAAELISNLGDNWQPIIDADIDGPDSLPVRLDNQLPNLGRYQAARRVARTVFIGSAPGFRSPTRGIDAARVRLGCALPGETLAAFGDALNRMSRATYFYAEAGRYWYGLQPTVGRLARERAGQLLNEAREEITAEIVRRLRGLQRAPGAFRGVHPASDVPDDPTVRLVVLGPDQPHLSGSDDSAALAIARDVLQSKGPQPREYRNCLVFLAADNRRIEALETAAAEHLAWSWVTEQAGADALNLDAAQAARAQTSMEEADRTVGVRLAEAYQWLLVPSQPDPSGPVQWEPVQFDGARQALAERAAEKLENHGYLYVTFAAVLLRQRLDNELSRLWGGGYVQVSTLWEPFARYLYLPRLRDATVLWDSVANGAASPEWQRDGFAVADGLDGDRFLGLTAGTRPTITGTTLVVRPDKAAAQFAAEQAAQPQPPGPDHGGSKKHDDETRPDGDTTPTQPQRFHGAVMLDSTRGSRDFGKVAEEIIAQLTALLGTNVEVTVEIKATNPAGFPDTIVRNITENAKTLGFQDGSGFEDR